APGTRRVPTTRPSPEGPRAPPSHGGRGSRIPGPGEFRVEAPPGRGGRNPQSDRPDAAGRRAEPVGTPIHRRSRPVSGVTANGVVPGRTTNTGGSVPRGNCCVEAVEQSPP